MGFVSRILGFCVVSAVLALHGTPASAQATLAAVKKRGQLACGVNGSLPPFSFVNDKKERVGFDVDYCKAIAAATLGDATKVHYITLPFAKRFDVLKSGEIDVLSRHSIVTMDRTAGTGVRAAAVTYIDGQAFVVARSANVAALAGLDKQTICFTKNTPHQANVENWFTLRGLTLKTQGFEDQDEMYKAFFDGKCVAVTHEATILASTIIASGKAANYIMLPEIISSEPLGPYVKAGDDQWWDIVHWTQNAMIAAEERGISQVTVDDQRNSKDPEVRRLLGTDPGDGKLLGLDDAWAYNVIKQVGNYSDVYERNLGVGSPLKFGRGINALWGKGGVMYSVPTH
ncbi:MAG TPA: amino acid ABC transporter substrate-binding protein [Reyranella sp.]|nr:amino acid ABC transporter substrate-binding protein [Reyranella sp.]